MTHRTQHSTGIPVRLSGVSKSFGAVRVLDRIDLEVPAGAFVTLLGPSGSGKTTILRLLAGFLAADAGDIRFGERSMTGVPPHRRDIGMVFQGYALFPHMNVAANVGYPLRMRRMREGAAARVADALAMVGLERLANRMPAELSGGQRQRVAMARALVSRPPLVLLDEPLSALDKALRERLQVELKAIHRDVGTTFVFVTHDQGEALALSDLVVVMSDGRIEQADRPERVWAEPANATVARFLGGSNLLPAIADGDVCRLADGTALASARGARTGAVEVAFRPERVAVLAADHDPAPDGNVLSAVITETIFLGESVRVLARVGEHEVAARVPATSAGALRPGAPIRLAWPVDATAALPVEGPR